MKVITAQEMASLEKKAISEGASGDEFMQNAAAAIADILSYYCEVEQLEKEITLIVGKGNNAGDGFCASTILLQMGYKIKAYSIYPTKECSPLCKKYSEAFEQVGGDLEIIQNGEEIHLPQEGIILDGILGTGFSGKIDDRLKNIFNHLNTSQVPIFSIDIPSGVAGDSGQIDQSAITADYTIFLGLAKKGFFFHEGWDHVGKLIYADFGLQQKYVQEVAACYEMIIAQDCMSLLPQVKRSRHKYEAGFVAGFAGSDGMVGASILSGMGALKSGAGIVKMIHFDHEPITSGVYPELIHLNLDSKKREEISAYIQKASAILVGPGLGVCQENQDFIAWLFQNVDKPFVIDADAITMMAQGNLLPPKKAIITPHHQEAKRLLKLESSDTQELAQACQRYAAEHGVSLILKGGPTFIFSKDQTPLICCTGDPGMATAGSGDVLSGIIAGLLAQPHSSIHDVAKLAVYIHGRAGEFAADKKTSYCLTATDLLKMIHRAFLYLLNPQLVDQEPRIKNLDMV